MLAWLIRLGKIAALGIVAYYIGGFLIAALLAVGLVWWLLVSESAVLGD